MRYNKRKDQSNRLIISIRLMIRGEYMKQLQEKLTEYLKNRTVDQITIQSIQETFEQVTVKDEETDLYLSHCLVDQKYEEDKVEKMLTILFENGLDPNTKSFGGYTFLHQALYGAENKEQENEIIPYPLSFFEKMIPLAKQYGYDVNIQDEDGDTLIHSAIYSEDYFDDIEPLIRLLGTNLNVTAKNDMQETIQDALEKSLKEAVQKENNSWKNKLEKSKSIIESIVSTATESPEEFIIIEYKKKEATIRDYLDPQATYKKLKMKIEVLGKNSNRNEFENLENEINNRILSKNEKKELIDFLHQKRKKQYEIDKAEVERIIQELTMNSTIEDCERLKERIQNSTLEKGEQEDYIKKVSLILEGIKEQLFLKHLKEKINNIDTICDIKACLQEAQKIKDDNLREEITKSLKEKETEANRQIDKLKELYQKIMGIKHHYKLKMLKDFSIDLKKFESLRNKHSINKINQEIIKAENQIEQISRDIKENATCNIQRILDDIKLLDEKLDSNLLDEILKELYHKRKETTDEKKEHIKVIVTPHNQ